ncbi:Retrovirus-related Pol polyprotein from transposon TNT 1-94 [Podarcis lilfordi]|uniref:Retrovirus-related Pol polyprotein from transposon TNT 1-94 n=1 Tax=Podarcis lilfordi TaxID=74358 RepID=A0AA35K182_9SAUR|nr:Retrovirus-related Pol polyprotein from transposon TNT 1-94 [Podarcis lilfordi]
MAAQAQQGHESFNIPFERLNGANWEDWSKRMYYWLEGKQLWECTQADPVVAGPNAAAADVERATAAAKKDKKAMSHVVMAIEASQLPHIDGLRTCHQIWSALTRIHQRTTAGAKIHVIRSLFEKRLSPGEPIRDHIAQMLTIFSKLRQLNVPFPDELKAYTLLSSLDRSYENLVLTMETMPPQDLTIEYISGRLIDEESKRQRAVKEGAGCTPRKSGGGAARSGEDCVRAFVSKRCYRCGSNTHLVRNCPLEAQDGGKDSGRRGMSTKQVPKAGSHQRRGKAAGQNKDKASYHLTAALVCLGSSESPSRGEAVAMATRKDTDSGGATNAMASLENSQRDTFSFVVDSGASHCLVNSRELLRNCKTVKTARSVILADGSKRPLTESGSLFCSFLGCEVPAYFVPELAHSLLSVSALMAIGIDVLFSNNLCSFYRDGKKIYSVERKDRLFLVEMPIENGAGGKMGLVENGACGESIDDAQVQCANVPPHHDCIHLWHRKFGHAGWSLVRKAAMNTIGCRFKACDKYLDCQACKQSKVTTCTYPRSERRTSKPFELVHADLSGPMPTPSLAGSKWVLILIDDFSKHTWLFTLRCKSEAAALIRDWITAVELRFSTRVVSFQSDRGGEFTGSALQSFFRQKGITHRLTAPYSPQQNGVAERKFRTLQESANAMLADSGLPQRFWAESYKTACFVQNRVFNSSVGDTPYFLLHGKKPKVDFFHIFGSQAWVLVPKAMRRKGEPRSRKMIFVGYEPSSKAWRFAYPTGNQSKLLISGSAEFCEQSGWKRLHGNPDVLLDSGDEEEEDEAEPVAEAQSPEQGSPRQRPQTSPKGSPKTPPQVSVKSEPRSEPSSPAEPAVRPKRRSRSEGEVSDTGDGRADPGESGAGPEFTLRRSARSTKGKPPERYEATSVWVGVARCEPESFEDVQKLPQAEASKWREAMQKEMNSMESLGVFSLTQLPANQRAVSCRWIYRLKPTETGEPQYKARLVARGFTQKKGVHFTEVYSPTSRAETLRMLLAIAAQRGWKVSHFDVDVAYLNSDLQEELYMLPPPGFEVSEQGSVWRLHKSIYGLRQSARNWNMCLHEALEELGFKRSVADSCLYLKGSGETQEVILVFVDDILMMSQTSEQMQKFARELGKRFKLKQLGDVKSYLGVQIAKTEDGSFLLCQKGKIEQLLEKFRMSDCVGARSPMEAVYAKECQQAERVVFENTEVFQSALGSLLYLSQWSRPDIAFAVNLLSREASNPSVQAWNGIKRVLRYLQETKDFCLRLPAQGEVKLTCFVDSDWANSEDRKSVSGLVVKFGDSVVGWRSRKQSLIALSSTEAEFSALSDACRELEFYVCLVKEICGENCLPVVVHEDNQWTQRFISPKGGVLFGSPPV